MTVAGRPRRRQILPKYDVVGVGISGHPRRFSTILTNIRVKRNSLDVYELVAPTLASFIQGDYAKHPQANMYVLDWLADGNQSDTQPTRNARGGAPARETLPARGAR